MRLLSTQLCKQRLKNDYITNVNIQVAVQNSSMCSISGAKWVQCGVSN